MKRLFPVCLAFSFSVLLAALPAAKAGPETASGTAAAKTGSEAASGTTAAKSGSQTASGTRAAAIPPVTTGTVELKEIKPTLNINVKTSQSRVFKTKTKILRVVVSDPSIAEPVVVSEREFMILGKSPGNVSIFVWCK